MIASGSVISVKEGDPHESVSVEWDVDGRCCMCIVVLLFILRPPGTVDVISPWELQLENQPVYKYANVPRGASHWPFATLILALWTLHLHNAFHSFFLQFYLASLRTQKSSLLLPTRLMVQELLMYKRLQELVNVCELIIAFRTTSRQYRSAFGPMLFGNWASTKNPATLLPTCSSALHRSRCCIR
jgi:hypothetical protein